MDARAFPWTDHGWRRPRFRDLAIYELHVGSFSPEGGFAGVTARLDHLAGLGVSAVELMPVADFPGACNWGYDGVLPYAPDSRYGRPEDLKALVQAAHARGLMMFLDVVYNHLGLAGDLLALFSKRYFRPARTCPGGRTFNFDGDDARTRRHRLSHASQRAAELGADLEIGQCALAADEIDQRRDLALVLQHLGHGRLQIAATPSSLDR